jgi:predicted dehydrogenase
LNELPDQLGQFDVVSICSPSLFHIENIQAALVLQPKLIFCEKPVSMYVVQTQQAVTDCAKQQVLLAVNHSRRWSPEVLQLKQQLQLYPHILLIE